MCATYARLLLFYDVCVKEFICLASSQYFSGCSLFSDIPRPPCSCWFTLFRVTLFVFLVFKQVPLMGALRLSTLGVHIVVINKHSVQHQSRARARKSAQGGAAVVVSLWVGLWVGMGGRHPGACFIIIISRPTCHSSHSSHLLTLTPDDLMRWGCHE